MPFCDRPETSATTFSGLGKAGTTGISSNVRHGEG
jgi:hypothetical protein